MSLFTSDIDYGQVASVASKNLSRFQETAVTEQCHVWEHTYEQAFPSANLVSMRDADVEFLFDMGNNEPSQPAARTIVAFGKVQHPAEVRDAAYQAGFPTKTVGSLILDRGHMMPYSGGGQFGPNIFLQDRALNRGWSAQGRRYRAMETDAVRTPEGILFCRLIYRDKTDVPHLIDLGYISNSDIKVSTFINRTDLAVQEASTRGGMPAFELRPVLDTLTRKHFGDVGEETARAYLEDAGATMMTLGDSGLPREDSRQDLDILALVDGELVTFEVKTTSFGKNAGKQTKEGNLYCPRRTRSRTRKDLQPSFDQGSFEYIKQRLQGTLEVDGTLESRIIAVDFQSLQLQQFILNTRGRKTGPASPVIDCSGFVIRGISRVLEHRGYL